MNKILQELGFRELRTARDYKRAGMSPKEDKLDDRYRAWYYLSKNIKGAVVYDPVRKEWDVVLEEKYKHRNRIFSRVYSGTTIPNFKEIFISFKTRKKK